MRYATDAEVPKRTRCVFCGERYAKRIADCECYDEYAMYCRQGSPGPGCPNGLPICNKCSEGK